MELDFFWLAIGLAAFGYFIGDGLKNFRNPSAKSFWGSLDDEEEHELIKESDVHHFIGITKEDATKLIIEYPAIPHIKLNGHVYYQKARLKEWFINVLGGN